MSTNSWEMMRVILKMKQHTKSVLILMNLRVRVQLAVIYLWLVQYEIRQSWQQVIEQIVTFLIHSGVYILSSNLKNFPPPLYFQLDFLPQGKKSAKRFLSFLGVERGVTPLPEFFFFGNLSIILAFSEQLFHNFPSLPLLSNLPHLIFFPNTPTTW